MIVRELMRSLLEMDPEFDVRCINRNDERTNEFNDDPAALNAEMGADVTSVLELDNSAVIYYTGDVVLVNDDPLDEV